MNPKLTLNLGRALGSVHSLHRRDQPPRVLPARARSRRSTSTRRSARCIPAMPRVPQGGYDARLAEPRSARSASPTIRSATAGAASAPATASFYDRPNTIATNSPANQGPFGTVVTLPRRRRPTTSSTPYAGRDQSVPGRSVQRAARRGVRAAAQRCSATTPDMENGRLQSWNVTVEREIVPTYLVRAAYAGSKGDQAGDGPRGQRRDLRAGRDHGDDQPAPAAVSRLRHASPRSSRPGDRSITRCS